MWKVVCVYVELEVLINGYFVVLVVYFLDNFN